METINSINILDPALPFAEKLTKEFGLAVAQMIASDWLDGSGKIGGNCNILQRSSYVRKKRLFVRGEQDVSHFKEAFSPREGALEFHNIDFRNINWPEKFCRIVSNGISDKNWKLDVRATDRLAAMNKQAKRDRYLKYMLGKPLMQKMQAMGVPIKPQGTIPEDEQELEMFLEIKDKPKIEIAEEILIDYVLNTNRWDFLSGQYNKDIVDVGLMIARVYLDKNDGIKLAYVDPENYLHSRVSSNDFHDKFYEGVIDTITISDIRREAHGELSDNDLRQIAKSYWKKPEWNDNCNINEIVDIRVPVLRFAYKTSKTITYKKNTRKGKAIKANRYDNYSGPEKNRISATFDTWLEGNFVVGTKKLYCYKECESVRDDVMNKALSPFITIAHGIYENRLSCFSDNIEVPAALLQKAHLKVQHLLNELKPDGVAIDINMLAELDDGKGGPKKEIWQTALNLWETKGIAFVKTINMGEDGVRTGTAITPLALQQGSALAPLLNVWAHYYNHIRETTGINPARDGSMPSDALVGVNQLAQLASNTVTKNIVDSAVLFKKRISEVISTRLHSVFTYKDATHLKEIYTNVVGKHMLDAVEVLKDRHLHEFGFTFEMYPTQQELQEFKEDLTLGIQEGTIDPQIKAEAVMIARTNIKLAIQYIMYHRRKKLKEAQEADKSAAQWKSQNDASVMLAAKDADLKVYSAQKEMDIKAATKLAEIEVLKEQALQQVRQPVEQREFQEKVYLEKLKTATEWETKKYLEDRKDTRTGIQATQQSKLKKQAQTDGEPIDFSDEGSWFQSSL